MKKPRDTMTTTVMWLFLYLLVLWFAILLASNYQTGVSILELIPNLTYAMNNPLDLNFNEYTLKFVFIFSLCYGMSIAAYHSTYSKRRMGEEHGSATWGSVRGVCKQFAQDRNTDRIFTQNVRMGLDGYKHRRNLNTLVIGGSGAGKTRGYALPNLMQAGSSFVTTDPKGEIMRTVGNLLEKEDYIIKAVNLIDFAKSDHYNPFKYINDEKDVIKLINNLIRNTTPKGASQNDPFWEKAETALLQAIMFYLLNEAPEEEQNFSMVMTMIEHGGANENDDQHISPLDLLFLALEAEKPNSIAVKQYHVFKQAAGKTAKSILVACAVRLAAFNIQQIQQMTNDDDLDIASIGEQKTALFAIIPDNDSSFNFLVGMLYTQIFQTLYYSADNKYSGKLPIDVHFMLDEFANVALPEEFDKVLATMRSRGISASIIIQNLAQLKSMFKGDNHMWETISGNCDSLLFLGGNESSTHDYISKMLGKSTIETRTFGHSKGRNGSFSTNRQIVGRELLLPNEVREVDNDYALLFVRGAKPVWDKKYNILSHKKNYLTTNGKGEPYEHVRYSVNTIGLDEYEFNTKSRYKILY